MSYLNQQPDSVSVSNEGMFQVMAFRAGGKGRLRSAMIVIASLVVALLIYIELDVAGFRRALTNPNLFQLAITGIALLTVLFCLISPLRRIFNRTSVHVGGGQLLVHSGPFPPFRARDFGGHELRNLQVIPRGTLLGKDFGTRFDIAARTIDGETRRVIVDVPDKPAAEFLKE